MANFRLSFRMQYKLSTYSAFFILVSSAFVIFSAAQRELVPAMFIFGDSLIDCGNNNDLASLAKANYLPYGIDFPGGPTGRFSNGYTIVDELADLLGLPLVPANSEASGEAVMHGVNYASAAAGILDNTGQNFAGRIPFNQQIGHFKSTVNQLKSKLGANAASHSISGSIFFVGMGSNDYLNNYLMPNYDTRNQYNPQQYADLLIQQYNKQLMTLYNLGARKFVISGVGSMACIPNILARNPFGRCSPDIDENLIIPFNNNVKAMINRLNVNTRAKFVYIDTFNMIQEILQFPAAYGFLIVDRGCCGIGRNRGQITCLPLQPPCLDRNRYIFWDAFHPTAAVNILMAREAFAGSRSSVFPMNIQQLVNLDLS